MNAVISWGKLILLFNIRNTNQKVYN